MYPAIHVENLTLAGLKSILESIDSARQSNMQRNRAIVIVDDDPAVRTCMKIVLQVMP
jgi:hypothetical protein